MSRGADLLRDKILAEGRVDGPLLLVDGFLNHRVEPELLGAVGAELAERFGPLAPDLVMTAEASGIPPGMACATNLRVPLIYAKKYLGPGDRHAFAREVHSATRGIEYRVEVSRRVLTAGHRVLIVDDFLAGGRTAEALGEITEEAAGTVVGFGFVVEKSFQEGRSRLESHGWAIESLVRIASLDGGVIRFLD